MRRSSQPKQARVISWGAEPAPGRNETASMLAEEEPLEIRIRGKTLTVLMRTPGADEELAAGLLWSEGIIRNTSELVEIAPCKAVGSAGQGRILNVFLAPGVVVDWERIGRHLLTGSSCGLCGATAIESVCREFSPVQAGGSIQADTLARLPDLMRGKQALFHLTGGVHAAALFTERGRLLVLREDVGRHNALDKVVGFALRRGLLPLSRAVLIVSGRVSFEIMQKALAAGIPIIGAVSAPTDLAVSFSQQSGQTLAGFIRRGRLTLFSHPSRIRKH